MAKPYDKCVFCNGTGKFFHISGKWYKCYCVSFTEMREEREKKSTDEMV